MGIGTETGTGSAARIDAQLAAGGSLPAPRSAAPDPAPGSTPGPAPGSARGAAPGAQFSAVSSAVSSAGDAPSPADPTAPPQVPARAGRRAPKPAAQRAPELAHLSLAALRAYRQELTEEENRVSYWRRILQARLDLLGVTPDVNMLARLREVLTDAGTANRRSALLAVLPADDVPPLPDLSPLWQAPAGDDAGSSLLREQLVEAEQQLSAFRLTLHQRLDQATGDLIARYAEEPSRCLSALPLAPRDR